MMEDYYTIQTPDHHVLLFSELHTLQKQGVLCDVILSAEDGEVMAHKVVLMSASKYFREKLSPAVGAPASRIFLKGISVVELANLVKYIYTGKLLVAKETMDITLEVSEILELNGVIKGYKEIITYERMKGGDTADAGQPLETVKSETETSHFLAEQNELQHVPTEIEQQALPLTTNSEKTLNAENVRADTFDDDDNDVDLEYQTVTQVHEVQEDGSTICYTVETPITTSPDGIYTSADGITNTSTLNTSGDYTFEVNPYDEQYMDVSVGSGSAPRSMPMPRLQKMVAPISSSQEHQDLLAVAIESLKDSSPYNISHNQIAENMGSGLESQETTIGSNYVSDGQHITPIKGAIAAADNILIKDVKYMASSPVKQETTEEAIENGMQVLTQTIYTNVATENADGKTTEVYSVSLDMEKVKKPLIIPPDKKPAPIARTKRKKKGRPPAAPIEIPIEAIQNYFEGNPHPNSLRKGGPSTRRVSPRKKTPIKSLLSLEGLKFHKANEKDTTGKSPKVTLKAPVSKSTKSQKIGDIEVEIAVSSIHLPEPPEQSASSSVDVVGSETLPVSTSVSSEIPTPAPTPPKIIAETEITQADFTAGTSTTQIKSSIKEVLEPVKTLNNECLDEKKQEVPKMQDFGQSIDFESDSDFEIIYTDSEEINEKMQDDDNKEEELPKSGIFIQPFAKRTTTRCRKTYSSVFEMRDTEDITTSKTKHGAKVKGTKTNVDPKPRETVNKCDLKQVNVTNKTDKTESVETEPICEKVNIAEMCKTALTKVMKTVVDEQSGSEQLKTFVGTGKVAGVLNTRKSKISLDNSVVNIVDENTAITEKRPENSLKKSKINETICDKEDTTQNVGLKSDDECTSSLEAQITGTKKKCKKIANLNKAKFTRVEELVENIKVVEKKDNVATKNNNDTKSTDTINKTSCSQVIAANAEDENAVKKSKRNANKTDNKFVENAAAAPLGILIASADNRGSEEKKVQMHAVNESEKAKLTEIVDTGSGKKSKRIANKTKANTTEEELIVDNVIAIANKKRTNETIYNIDNKTNLSEVKQKGAEKKSQRIANKTKSKHIDCDATVDKLFGNASNKGIETKVKTSNIVIKPKTVDEKLNLSEIEDKAFKKKSKRIADKSRAKFVEGEATVDKSVGVANNKEIDDIIKKSSIDNKIKNVKIISEVNKGTEKKFKIIANRKKTKYVEDEVAVDKLIDFSYNESTKDKTKDFNIDNTAAHTQCFGGDEHANLETNDRNKKTKRSIHKTKSKFVDEEVADQIIVSTNKANGKKAKKASNDIIKLDPVETADDKDTEKSNDKTSSKKRTGKAADTHAAANDGCQKNNKTNKVIEAKGVGEKSGKSSEVVQCNKDEKLNQQVAASKTPVNKSHVAMEEKSNFSEKVEDGKIRSSASKRKGKIPRRLPLIPDEQENRRRLQITENIPMVRTRRSSARSNSESRCTQLTSSQANDIDTAKDLSDAETVNFSEKGIHEMDTSIERCENEINVDSTGEIGVSDIPAKAVNVVSKIDHYDDKGYTVVKDPKVFPKVLLKKHTNEEILQLVRNIATSRSPKTMKGNVHVETEGEKAAITSDLKATMTSTHVTDKATDTDTVPLEMETSVIRNENVAKRMAVGLRSAKRKLTTIAIKSKAKKKKSVRTSVTKSDLEQLDCNLETPAIPVENNSFDSSKANDIEISNTELLTNAVPLVKSVRDNIFDILSPRILPKKSLLLVPDDMKAMKDNYLPAVAVNEDTSDAKSVSPVKELFDISNKNQTVITVTTSPNKDSPKETDVSSTNEMEITESNTDVCVASTEITNTDDVLRSVTDDSNRNDYDKDPETPTLTCTNIPDVADEELDEAANIDDSSRHESDYKDDDDDITEFSLGELVTERETGTLATQSENVEAVTGGNVEVQDTDAAGTMAGSFECPEEDCDFRTGDPSSLSVHLKNKHYSVKAEVAEPAIMSPSSLTCRCCRTKFKSKAALKQHEKRKQYKTLSCDICSKSFHKLNELHKHRFKLHDIAMPESYTRYQCNLCEFVSWSQAAVDNHNLSHEDTRSLTCTVCSKAFKSQYDLTRHTAIHKEKTFLCDKCDYMAVTSDALSKHRVARHSHHLVEYKCSLCTYKSPHKGNLHSHTRRVHGLKIITRGGHVQERAHYPGLPPGTLVTEDGGVFSIPKSLSGQQGAPAQQRKRKLQLTDMRHKTRRKFSRRDEKVKDSTSLKLHQTSKTLSDWQPTSREEVIKAFQAKAMKRHEQFMKKPPKTYSFMSSTLKGIINQPSFPQSSPGLRAARVSKLYNVTPVQEMPVVHIMETPQSVVNNVDNEIVVPNGDGAVVRTGFHEPSTYAYHFMDNPHTVGLQESVVSTSEAVSGAELGDVASTEEQVIIIQARDDQSLMPPEEFVQSMIDERGQGDETTQSLNALSAFLAAGHDEVEIQNN